MPISTKDALLAIPMRVYLLCRGYHYLQALKCHTYKMVIIHLVIISLSYMTCMISLVVLNKHILTWECFHRLFINEYYNFINFEHFYA